MDTIAHVHEYKSNARMQLVCIVGSEKDSDRQNSTNRVSAAIGR